MQLVVGVAILSGAAGRARVLAARRTRPAALAGGWELPGGKVDDGEDPAAAAVREIREELGCDIEVTGWLTAVAPEETEPSAIELRVATAVVLRREPVPDEHDIIRWLGAGQLDEVAWLPADVPFLDPVRAALRSHR